jgi:hypothetical protein
MHLSNPIVIKLDAAASGGANTRSPNKPHAKPPTPDAVIVAAVAGNPTALWVKGRGRGTVKVRVTVTVVATVAGKQTACIVVSWLG